MGKKSNKWVKPRHKFYWGALRFLIRPFLKIKYNVKYEKFNRDKNRAYFIVHNHQSPLDELIISQIFKTPLYCIATEDLFSNGFISKVIKYGIEPIPFKKSTTDILAVKYCMQVARENGTIVLAPEGNRTYSGELCNVKKSCAKLIKATKLPLAIVRQENCYNVIPRWADKTRKGECKVFVSKVLETEEIRNMSDDELYGIIINELSVNEYSFSNAFKSNRRAEYLERSAYVCPTCGLSKFESNKNEIKCLKCGLTVEYKEDKSLKGVNADFPFKYYNEWYNYQNDYVNKLDLNGLSGVIYQDNVKVSEVIVGKKKKVLDKTATLKMFNDKYILVVNGVDNEYYFNDIKAVACLGRNKLNVYTGDKIYQIKGEKRFNALKYMNIYYRYVNIKENENGTFLGI